MTTGVGTLFAALADDTRRTVLGVVASSGPTTATRVTDRVPVSRQAIAKHLSILEDAGLVTQERVGRETLYRVVPGSLRPVRDWVATTDEAWSRRLGDLQRHLALRRGDPPDSA